MPQDDYFYDERNRTRPPDLPFTPSQADYVVAPPRPPNEGELTMDPSGRAVIPAGGMKSPFRPEDPTLAQLYGEFPGDIGRYFNKPPMNIGGTNVDLGGMIPAAGAIRAGKAGMFTGAHPQGAPIAFSKRRTGAGQGGFGPGGDIMHKKQMYGTIDRNVAMTAPLKGEGAAVSVRTPGGQVHRVMSQDLQKWQPQHGHSVSFRDPSTGQVRRGMVDNKTAFARLRQSGRDTSRAAGHDNPIIVRLPHGDVKLLDASQLSPAAPRLQGGSGYYHPSSIRMFRK